MARKLAPASADDVQNVQLALYHLRQARDHLKRANTPQAAAKVASTIKSTEGALRHVQRRADVTAAAKPCL